MVVGPLNALLAENVDVADAGDAASTHGEEGEFDIEDGDVAKLDDLGGARPDDEDAGLIDDGDAEEREEWAPDAAAAAGAWPADARKQRADGEEDDEDADDDADDDANDDAAALLATTEADMRAEAEEA